MIWDSGKLAHRLGWPERPVVGRERLLRYLDIAWHEQRAGAAAGRSHDACRPPPPSREKFIISSPLPLDGHRAAGPPAASAPRPMGASVPSTAFQKKKTRKILFHNSPVSQGGGEASYGGNGSRGRRVRGMLSSLVASANERPAPPPLGPPRPPSVPFGPCHLLRSCYCLSGTCTSAGRTLTSDKSVAYVSTPPSTSLLLKQYKIHCCI